METKINKLVFSNDGKKVKVAFKDGTATIDFESKIDAIKIERKTDKIEYQRTGKQTQKKFVTGIKIYKAPEDMKIPEYKSNKKQDEKPWSYWTCFSKDGIPYGGHCSDCSQHVKMLEYLKANGYDKDGNKKSNPIF